MKPLEEYKELTKRYDDLIKSGAGYDECRVIAIRMSALELAVKQEQIENEDDFLTGYREGYMQGYKDGFHTGRELTCYPPIREWVTE